ncbi:xylulokinase [Paenibacillus thalictri]|uniref:Carbohydrate kinase n=1 Tax=Paenibacillus thalictri TaxID=2527873 RepID=A0A4Q9DKV9_9BACL|nr:FGGY-family carbohydrate kinase [Paenibacillus thalictri]TBL75619.1 hypothetical protein EYB31_21725 [Paenibacillus thalictri]
MEPEQKPMLAVDIGSTNIKAALIDKQGKLLASGRAPFPAISSEGRCEADADELWRSFIAAVSQLHAKAGSLADIGSVAITSQMAGLVLLDEMWHAVGPVIPGVDQRGSVYVPELMRRMAGHPVHAVTGCPPLGIYPAPKLLCLAAEQPALLQKARYIGGIKEWMLLKLTGGWITDPASASCTQLFDQRQRGWWPEMIAAAGIGHLILPEVRNPDERAGILLPQAADVLQLPAELPVYVGTGDGPAANLATGAVEPGSLCISLGTTAVVRYMTEHIDMTMENKRHFRQWFGWHWYMQGFRLEGAGRDIEAFLPQAEASSHADAFPICYNPHAADHHRRFIGDWAGADANSRLQAVLDGILFALYEEMKPALSKGTFREIRPVGGGAGNLHWMKELAGLFGLPVILTESGDSALGAAMIAMKQAGGAAAWSEAAQAMVHVKTVIQALPEFSRTMQAKYETYRLILKRGESE